MYQWNVQKRREAWKLLGIIPKELAGLSGCQNATSAINFLDEQHEMTPGSPHQRITGTSANAVLFSFQNSYVWRMTMILRYMAGHGEVLLPTKPQGRHRRAFPGFQPGVSLSASPLGILMLLTTHAPRCSTAGTRAVSRTWRSPTTRPPGSRRHFQWWTSYTWCSLGASSEWAALCGHRPGRKGVSSMASVTWKPSSHHQGKKCGRETGCIFSLYLYLLILTVYKA